MPRVSRSGRGQVARARELAKAADEICRSWRERTPGISGVFVEAIRSVDGRLHIEIQVGPAEDFTTGDEGRETRRAELTARLRELPNVAGVHIHGMLGESGRRLHEIAKLADNICRQLIRSKPHLRGVKVEEAGGSAPEIFVVVRVPPQVRSTKEINEICTQIHYALRGDGVGRVMTEFAPRVTTLYRAKHS